MKYMKLGHKPDTFRADGNTTTVATDLPSDVVFIVGRRRYHLHKFPLLAKCSRLLSLAISSNAGAIEDEVDIKDIPGARCAAEYLGMTESMEKGNLGLKIDFFMNSSIFCSWRDSIISLEATKSLLPWVEDLKLVSRCIDAIASKAVVNPKKVDWSFTITRYSSADAPFFMNGISPPWNGIQSDHVQNVPEDWWIEDICELDIDHFWKVMLAIKAKSKVSSGVLGEALRVYAYRWLPGVAKDQNLVGTVRGGPASGFADDFVESAAKHRFLLETIVGLLPADRGTCSCSFLLKLLKAANILGAEASSKLELAKRIGLQLEDASLNDLLIPSLSYASDTLYDVDIVHCIVGHFVMQDRSPAETPSYHSHQFPERQSPWSTENLRTDDNSKLMHVPHSIKIRVAKLVDGYLSEIARDSNLVLSKFISLAELIPDFARPVHDGLYRAIDVYLKEHPGLTKTERKRVCQLMDCRKLSMDACMHAAQNDRLPLRVVVQVLFFEQVRAAMAGGFLMNELPSNIKALLPQNEGIHHRMRSTCTLEDWEVLQNECAALKCDLDTMKQNISKTERIRSSVQKQVVNQSKSKGIVFFPKKVFSKLWSSVHQSGERLPDSPGSSENLAGTTYPAVVKEQPKQHTRRSRRHSMS
ncbi:hypothetical protein KP509_22G026400 [Ceratopteris richardii]|uniref:NPH3 domain-containing protein n=1 Tax=Ceratopteris richardii TaxID=49495 RepID=A0A8T2S3H5_CERRI|nr:hypothetical protein KP509_22G026400 [Ceratopteris richardii]